MELLKEKILQKAHIKSDNILRVDSFLNHQMDIKLFNEIGKEFFRLFSDCDINKILTIEPYGTGIACIAAQYFGVPVVVAKRGEQLYISGDVYTTKVRSVARDTSYDIAVAKKFLHRDDRLLVLDDILSGGNDLQGLLDIIQTSGATLKGVGIVIEKAFSGGGKRIRDTGIRVESLAIIESMDKINGIKFKEE